MIKENGNHVLKLNIPFLPIHCPGGTVSGAGTVLAAANSAYLYPIWVPSIFTTNAIILNIATSSGNIDVGLYDKNGNRVVSRGSVASPGTGQRSIAISSTKLNPGLSPYWIAIAADNTTVAFRGQEVNIVPRTFRFASSFPLPATLNLASPTSREDVNIGAILKNANFSVSP